MKTWWQTLQTRERLLLITGGALVIVALLYALLWHPLAKSNQDLATQVVAQHKALAWMQTASLDIQALRQTSAGPVIEDRRSLLAIVDGSAKQAGLRQTIQRMEPVGEDSAKLWIEDADFDAVIRWLGLLQRQHGIELTSVVISPIEAPGQVDVRLNLQRA